jgi:prevent-host-death family protein
MKRVKIAELKNHLSEHLRAVERGEQIEVTDRNRPIARLIPAPPVTGPALRPSTRPFSEVRGRRFGRRAWSVSSLELLLEERGTR